MRKVRSLRVATECCYRFDFRVDLLHTDLSRCNLRICIGRMRGIALGLGFSKTDEAAYHTHRWLVVRGELNVEFDVESVGIN